LEEVFSGIELE